MTNFPIIDGHNDTLLSLHLPSRGKERSFFEESTIGHIDLPRAKKGGLGGGFFAMFSPNPSYELDPEKYLTKDGFDLPLPPPIDHDYALQTTNALAAKLFHLEAESNGQLKVVRTAEELSHCLQNDITAAIFHIEGAEAIDKDFNSLHVLHKAGLRSLGIVWSRPNDFGEGVPFRFPSTPDIGSGLTDLGKALVRECNQLGIMVDTTHLNEKGFWDVAKLTDLPIVATHSNAHALCPISRNLTDKQLSAIAESGGVAGINYSVMMLREDGGLDTKSTSLDEIVRHVDYIAEHFGIDHVALGSDFDGTNIPEELGDVTGLPRLLKKLKKHGFRDEDLRKITHENWVRVLKDTWKA